MQKKFGQRSDGKWIRFHTIEDDLPPTRGNISDGIANTMITRSEKAVKPKSKVPPTHLKKRGIEDIPIKLPKSVIVKKRDNSHDVDKRMNVSDEPSGRNHPKYISPGIPEEGRDYFIPSRVSESELAHIKKMAEIERKRRNPMNRRQRTNSLRKRTPIKKKKTITRKVVRRRT